MSWTNGQVDNIEFQKCFSLYVVYICSARLAAAAGTGDHCGPKEDAKKDVITGREPLQMQKSHFLFNDCF